MWYVHERCKNGQDFVNGPFQQAVADEICQTLRRHGIGSFISEQGSSLYVKPDSPWWGVPMDEEPVSAYSEYDRWLEQRFGVIVNRGNSVQTSPESNPPEFEEGVIAFNSGTPRGDCPYGSLDGAGYVWQSGWDWASGLQHRSVPAVLPEGEDDDIFYLGPLEPTETEEEIAHHYDVPVSDPDCVTDDSGDREGWQ